MSATTLLHQTRYLFPIRHAAEQKLTTFLATVLLESDCITMSTPRMHAVVKLFVPIEHN